MVTMQIRRHALVFFSAVVVTLIAVTGVHLLQSMPGYVGYKVKLATREHKPLKPGPIPSAWVISGSPVCQSNVFGRSHDNSTSSGIWECTGPTQFVWHYGDDETIHVLEGSADIEYLGKKFSLNAGDSTHFAAGTTAKWAVHGRVKKAWTIYEPGRLTRMMRRIFT